MTITSLIRAAAVAALFIAPTHHAAAQAPQQWTLVEDVRIGDENHADYVLESIRWLLPGRSSEIYAAEARAAEILVYDAHGRFVRRFGGRGQGPGEFAAITDIGWMGDTLWASDQIQGRVTLFTREGTVLRTHPLPRTMSRASGNPLDLQGRLSDGSALALPPLAAHYPGTTLLRSTPLLRQGLTAERPDTLAFVRRTPSGITVTEGGTSRTLRIAVPRNDDRVAVAPDGSFIVIVRSDERNGVIDAYTVEAVDAAGRRIFIRRFEHQPILLTEQERDRSYAVFAERLVSELGMARTAAVRRARELLPVPRSWLAGEYVFIGSDGRIRLSRRDMPGMLLVLDSRTGREIAHVRLPGGRYPGYGVDTADAESVWMVVHDEMRVPYIVRYRIETGR